MKRLKVIYVAGFGRSGSTLLDNMLNEVDGVLSIGELRYLWDRGMVEDRQTGSGEPFSTCPFWQRIVRRVYGDPPQVDPMAVAAQREQVHSRHVLTAMVPFGERVIKERAQGFAAHIRDVYFALQEETGCDVIVDSSKFPSYGLFLEQIPEVDVYVVHLVRDARAVAFSWQRKKKYDERHEIKRQTVWRSTWLWTTWNSVVELRWAKQRGRYMRVRYEDLVANPRDAIARVLAFAGHPQETLPFIQGQMVTMQGNWAVAGNPSRFRSGPVTLRLDDEWRTRMPSGQQRVVNLMASPLLKRYGYSTAS